MLRSLAKSIDNALLGGTIQKRRREAYIQAYTDRNIALMSEGFEYRFTSYYKKNKVSYLSELCDKYGSDKGEIRPGGHPYSWPSHTYADYYSRLFHHCRDSVRSVFECGLGTNNPGLISSMGVEGRPGASLRIWRDYFPNAQIFGADIDRACLFEEDRIKTFWVDQLDPQAISAMWRDMGLKNFDLIIDDGLHTFAAGSCLFSHSSSLMAENGLYIIEDVMLHDLPLYKDFFLDSGFDVDFVNLYRPGLPLQNNNNLIVVRHP